jgi:hypothetical protein
MSTRACLQKVVAVFLMLVLLCFFPSSGRAESSAEDDSVYCRSRRRAFYGSKGKIELAVVKGELVVLSQEYGFICHNNLYVVNGIEVSLIASLWGYYSLLGGNDKIILEKDRVNFLYHYYEGATLYAITLDGKRETFQKYVTKPFYALVDGCLFYSANGEKDKISQWDSEKKNYDVLEKVDGNEISTFDNLLCISKPSPSSTDYVFWLPSERQMVSVYCGENYSIRDFARVHERILWSDEQGIHSFNMENGMTEILITYSKDSNAECQTYFFVSGSEVYYTDDGILKMYNIENQTHESWNIRPDNPEGFVVIDNILYMGSSRQVQYVFLSDVEKCGIIEIN